MAPSHRTVRLGLVTVAAIVVIAVLPAPARAAAGTPQSRYRQDVAACGRITARDAHQNCLSEASTTYAMTQPTAAGEQPDQLSRNALRRCEPLPADQRADCVARMKGEGTVSGSVDGGGVLRTLTTVVPPPAADAAPPPAASPQ